MKINWDPTQESSLRVNVLYSEREEDSEFYIELLPIKKKYKLTKIIGGQKSYANIRHIPPGRYKIVLRGGITEMDIFQEKEKSSGDFSQIIEVDLKPDKEKIVTFNLGSEISVEFNVFLDNQVIDRAAITISKMQMTKFIKNSRAVIFALKPDLYNIIIEIRDFKINRYVKIEPEDEVINFYITSQEIMFREWNLQLKKNEIDNVLQSANSLLEKHPDYADISLLVGRLYSLKKDYKTAFIYFQSALKKNKEFLDAYIYSALLLVRTNNFNQAINFLKKARELNLFINDKIFEASLKAIEMKRTAEAESLIAKAFEYNPFILEMHEYSLDKIPIYINYTDIAKEYFNKGELQKSKKAIKKLLKLQPEYVDMLYISGLIEYYQSNNEDALIILNKAYKINPDFLPVLLILGRIYFRLEKHPKAQEFFFRALNIDKGNKIAKIFINKIKAKASSKPITEDIEITYN